MTISGISQDVLMSITHRMQPPNATNMANRIMKKLDSDEDGTLSTEEINNGGQFAEIILQADTDGDGSVTSDELVSKITEDINNGKIGPPPMSGMGPPSPDDIASNIIEELDSDGDGLLSKDELVSGITEKMQGRPAPPIPPDDDDDEDSDTNQVKKLLALIGLTQSDQAGQSESDITSRILSQMNLSDEESETISEILQNAGLSTLA